MSGKVDPNPDTVLATSCNTPPPRPRKQRGKLRPGRDSRGRACARGGFYRPSESPAAVELLLSSHVHSSSAAGAAPSTQRLEKASSFQGVCDGQREGAGEVRSKASLIRRLVSS